MCVAMVYVKSDEDITILGYDLILMAIPHLILHYAFSLFGYLISISYGIVPGVPDCHSLVVSSNFINHLHHSFSLPFNPDSLVPAEFGILREILEHRIMSYRSWCSLGRNCSINFFVPIMSWP